MSVVYRKRKHDQLSSGEGGGNAATTVASPIFDLYSLPTFDESIRKIEYRPAAPFVKSFNCNDIVEISINQVDSFFFMQDTLMLIKGKLDITGEGDVTLAPNYGAFLFDSCVYSESGKELETVRDPGIVSTVRALTCYSPEESKHMSIAGWNYPTVPILSSDKSFSLLMPLRHIFNMFNDYPLITCGRQTLRFVRARNDNDCVIIKEKTVSGALTKTSVKLVIESIELRIKHIYPSDEVKEKLLKFISTNRPIMKWFRKWELHELPALTPSARREIWSVKISTKVERPRYVIVFFQTEKRDKIQSDPTTFDHIYIQSIRLSLNGDYYPNERTQLDFDNNHFTEAHFNYSEFQPSYTKNTQKRILLDYLAFKNRALFVIDCSKQEETMKSGSVDVKLDIEANNGFPENTKAYCIIIHDVLMEYSPLTEVLKNLS